jgi:hypothetical protein
MAIDSEILLTALLATMHVPIWNEDLDVIEVACSCGWNRQANGHTFHSWGRNKDNDDGWARRLATDTWLIHQRESERLTRAALHYAEAVAGETG